MENSVYGEVGLVFSWETVEKLLLLDSEDNLKLGINSGVLAFDGKSGNVAEIYGRGIPGTEIVWENVTDR